MPTDRTFDALLAATIKAAKTDPDIARRLRLWAADCAAHVLHLFERKRPGDDRPRRAIEAARAGAADANNSAKAADWTVFATRASWTAQAADTLAGRGIDNDASWIAAQSAAWAACAAGAADAAAAAIQASRVVRARVFDTLANDDADTRSLGLSWQHARLVARLSDPEPEDWPLDAGQETAP